MHVVNEDGIVPERTRSIDERFCLGEAAAAEERIAADDGEVDTHVPRTLSVIMIE
jgi:hypothetical protein